MENQNKPLLIRPSRTPKRIPKMIFCPKSFPTIGAMLFHATFQKICTNLAKPFRNIPNWYELNMESST